MSTTFDDPAYYEKVGTYYDEDAPDYENRCKGNATLQKIRNCFREVAERYPFSNALEIGFGLGLDLLYFGGKYPDRKFSGIDVSQRMYDYASSQLRTAGYTNVTIQKGSVEQIQQLYPGQQFDLIYVFFGALNTVADLRAAATQLKNVLAPGGKLVVTFINKWYLSGLLLPLIKGRFRIAFKRFQANWGGYSPRRHLDSRCYSPGEIKKAFKGFKVTDRKGYSIFYPAWYQDRQRQKLGKTADRLWKLDEAIQGTPLWSKGEYTLYVMEHA